MGLRDFLLAGLAACAVAGCIGVGADDSGQPQISPAAMEGRRLVQRSCSGCHATGAGSRYSSAPPLWSVGRYTRESLQRVLAQSPAHDRYAMPGIVLTPGEADNVIAYVEALAEADSDSRRRLGVVPCVLGRAC